MISNVPFVLSVLILCYSFGALRCGGAKLPQEEVETLRQIALKLGRGDFEFKIDQDPCRVKMVGLRGSVPQENQNNNITCPCTFENNTVCHVVGISLKGFSLPGVLPPELAKLSYLREIDLTRSYLNGTIPPEWASMRLDYISLTGNRLSGGIPKYLGNITTLKYLSLEANQFSGSLPSELEKLINIETLILSSNQLTGTLPTTLGKLKSIKDFRVNDNSFHGTIPDFIQNWSELEKLHIQGSGLQGPIPPAISRLAKMIDLRISDIKGRSAFPVINNMTRLQYLILRHCNIYGVIPTKIWEMKELDILDLSFNKLSGEIPSTLFPDQTYLSGNLLSGNVSDSISMKGVNNVDLSYNDFTVPTRCNNNTNVNFFRSLSDKNKLGVCKDFSMCLKYWHSFHINCGGDNVLVGNVTYEGDAAIEVGSAETSTSNTNWGISNTGHFMENIEGRTLFIESAISPLSMKNSELYSKARISPISLTYFGFCLENGSYTVKLHFAEILFTNDTTYNSLGRRIFDIYIQGVLIWKDFNIEDEVQGPGKEVIKEFSNASVTEGTLEIRFYWAGKGTTVIPRRGKYGPLISAISVDPNFKPKYQDSDAGKKRTIPIVVGVLASVLCSILFVLSILWWKGYFGGKKKREKDLIGMDLQTGSFTLRQLRAATNNFDPANKIGEGGFGSVYMGHLTDGTVIAVKQLSSKSRQGNREFVNEIGLILALQHPNLVKLHGCCSEGNQLLLVYEYMENNCLARALNERSQLKLDWATRYNICVGIAKGLAFLHEESPLKIVHRDIKATNVLLDRDLNAKISDFGLAKLDEEENTHISTRIAGTIGYMAPEYALWGYLTYKADVYSFGIVALEIVSGKSNSSYKPKDNFVCLLEWACVLQQRGSLTELVDPSLESEFNKEEAERMIRVALLCTNTSPSLRPTMSEAMSMLEGKRIIQDVFPNSSMSGEDVRFNFVRDYHHHSHILNSSGKQDDCSSSRIWNGSSLSEHELNNKSTSGSQDFPQR